MENTVFVNMDKTMLDVLKERLIDGLSIKAVKETYSKYTISFEFEGETAKADLPKSCAPNCQDKIADNSIITAMSTIYFNRGDFVKAREWLDKLIG